MTELHNGIDPELAAVLAPIPKTPYGMFDFDDLPGAREFVRSAGAQIAANAVDDPSVSLDTLTVPRDSESPVLVRVARPVGEQEALPCLLWFHGGGQILGRANDDDPLLKTVSSKLHCVVAAVDYRLAPEFPAPAAAEDGFLAYTYLVGNAASLGLRSDQVGLAGVSGGGGIAAATALMIRDRGAARPALLALNYPMLDDRNETTSSRIITDVGVWDRAANVFAWDAILAGNAGADDVDPYCAPARAENLSGLPPTFVGVAELDVFRDEDLAFALRLLADGVSTDLHLYAGATHAWNIIAPDSRLAHAFDDAWYAFLSRYLTANEN